MLRRSKIARSSARGPVVYLFPFLFPFLFLLLLVLGGFAGCRPPSTAEQATWVRRFNRLNHGLDSLNATRAPAGLDAATAAGYESIIREAQAMADSTLFLPGARRRLRLLAGLIGKAQFNKLAVLYEDLRQERNQLSSLAAAQLRHRGSSDPASAYRTCRELRERGDSLAARIDRASRSDPFAFSDSLLLLAANQPESWIDTVSVRSSDDPPPESLRRDLRDLRTKLRDLSASTTTLVQAAEARAGGEVRRRYRDRHNDLVEALNEAKAADDAGKHRTSVLRFGEVRRGAEALLDSLRAEPLLFGGGPGDSVGAEGSAGAAVDESAGAATQADRTTIELEEQLRQLVILAQENEAAAVYNYAADLYQSMYRQLAQRTGDPAHMVGRIDSLVGVPVLGPDLKKKLMELREDVLAHGSREGRSGR